MTDTASADAAGARPPVRWDLVRHALAPMGIFLGLLAAITAVVPAFIGGGGPSIIAQQATPILLVALGQCVVLMIGSIDLSNAALALFCAILTAMTLGPLGVASPLLCVAIVTLLGMANGFLHAYAQIPSFALTLGTLGLLQSANQVVTGNDVIYVAKNYEVVDWLFMAQAFGLPLGFWIAVAAAVALWAFVRYTSPGQGLMAVGFNERAAALSGLHVKGLKVLAFGLSGFFAGLAGVCVISIGGAASSYGLGSDLLVPSVAAALAGGTAITGGVANPINVVFGAMFIALIPVGSAAVGVTPQSQSIVYGLVLVVAVAATMSRARGLVVK